MERISWLYYFQLDRFIFERESGVWQFYLRNRLFCKHIASIKLLVIVSGNYLILNNHYTLENFIYLLILGYYAYLEQVCKLVHFFWVVRSTGRVPNLTTNHCIYACYVHFYKKFSEILKKVLVKWLPVKFNTCWFQTMNNILTGTFKLTETPCMGTWRDRVHSQ